MASSTVPALVSHSRGRYPLRWLTRSSLTWPYSALQRASASADMSASANVLTIARSRSGLAAARLSSARACRGRLSGAVIVLISFGLRHLEDQPVAVRLCGPHPNAGANPRIRSNPYTTSLDATHTTVQFGQSLAQVHTCWVACAHPPLPFGPVWVHESHEEKRDARSVPLSRIPAAPVRSAVPPRASFRLFRCHLRVAAAGVRQWGDVAPHRARSPQRPTCVAPRL